MNYKVFVLFLLAQFVMANSAFEAFGKKDGVDQLSKTFFNYLKVDENMSSFFKNTEKDKFIKNFSDQVCETLGGPCRYQGQNMYRAHKGHAINQTNFYQLIEVLQKAMRFHGIPNWAQNILLSKFAPMHKDIINE